MPLQMKKLVVMHWKKIYIHTHIYEYNLPLENGIERYGRQLFCFLFFFSPQRVSSETSWSKKFNNSNSQILEGFFPALKDADQ